MSEAVEQVIAQKSPLDETHRQFGTRMKEEGGWRLPAVYGDVSAEYAVVRGGGAGLIDFSSRGRIEVSGSEAMQFLNGLITNDVKTLEEGAWMPAAFPNAQGRLLASARVLRRGNTYLFDTEAVTHERVRKTLERFTLAGDFHVADITHETAQLSLQGAQAAEILAATLGAEVARLERHHLHCASWQDEQLTIIRATHTAEDGFDIITSAKVAPALWSALTAAGARPVGFDALEMLRIEAGLPRYGVDMDDSNVVTETGLDEAVSYTKGCYIGQEIIARIHWRGHVAKRLTGLSFADRGQVERDAKIRTADGKEIGRVTSVTFSPRLDHTIALGYVKYDYLAPGTPVRVLSGDEERAAHIVELPFVRGSWYEAGTSPEPKT